VGRKYPTNLHNQWLMEIKPISMAMMAAWVRSEAPYAGAASLDKEEPRTPTTRSSRVLHPKMPSFVTRTSRRVRAGRTDEVGRGGRTPITRARGELKPSGPIARR
jgi:hypothetical protein